MLLHKAIWNLIDNTDRRGIATVWTLTLALMRIWIAVWWICVTSPFKLLMIMPSTSTSNTKRLTATWWHRYRCCGCCECTSFILSNSWSSIVVVMMSVPAISSLSSACTVCGTIGTTITTATGVQMPSHNRTITIVLINRWVTDWGWCRHH